MATVSTAFGVLPSPKTQALGGNAGGGVGSTAPRPPRQQPQQPPAQAGMAPGATQTFAQMQRQGQARPAPPQLAQPRQPPMLSALSTQLAQPQQTTAQKQFTPEQVASAREQLRGLQSAGLSQISAAAGQWSPEANRFVSNYFSTGIEGASSGGGGAGGGGLGQLSYGWDGYGLPYAEFTAPGGTTQRVAQQLPQELEEVLGYAQLQDILAEQAAAAQAAPTEPSAMEFQSADAESMLPSQPLPPSGAFGGSSQAQFLRDQLMTQLELLGQGPAEIQGQSYEALREAKKAELEAEYGAERSRLEEELARRGLSASTIGGGRYGDLAGQQARAVASLEADLLRQQAEAEAKNRQMYLSGMSELAGIAGSQDLGAFEANLKVRQVESDISFRAQELQQEAALRGRELDLTSARDQASKEQASGQLALGYAEMGSRERMSAQEIASREAMQQSGFAFEAGQSALERSLRETMQTRELTAAERRQLAEIDANKALQQDRQTFEAGQSALERSLREKMQTTELSAAEKRQLADIEANKALQRDRQTFEASQTEKTQKFQADQATLDRDLRALLSGNELKQAQAQFDKRYGLELEQFGFQKGQSQNQFLSSLAAVLAPMDPKKRDEFLRTIGIKLPGTQAGTSSGTPSSNDTGI